MNAQALSLAAIIILLLPMIYFLFASLTFFLRRLSDPVVTWMLRGLLRACFAAVAATGAVAVMAFLLAGRPGVASGLGLLAGAALGARRWFLARLNAAIRSRDAGEAGALGGLRRLHLGAMAYNAAQVSLVVLSIPRLFPGL